MRGIRQLVATSTLGTVVIGGALSSFLSVASASPTSVPAVPNPGGAAVVQVPAATPASVPGVPFIESVLPEGLGALVNWNPNPATDQVSGYTLTAG